MPFCSGPIAASCNGRTESMFIYLIINRTLSPLKQLSVLCCYVPVNDGSVKSSYMHTFYCFNPGELLFWLLDTHANCWASMISADISLPPCNPMIFLEGTLFFVPRRKTRPYKSTVWVDLGPHNMGNTRTAHNHTHTLTHWIITIVAFFLNQQTNNSTWL